MWDNVIEINWIFLDGYGSKIRKVNRCRPALSNENIVATRQKGFFYKSNISVLDFWLMLLSWMFILSYTTIYFFVKKFIFSDVYISVNTIFECFYMFFGWEVSHQLSLLTTSGGMKGHPKCIQPLTGGGGVTPHVFERTYTVSFHFLAGFLSCGILFYLYKFNLTFIQKRFFHQKGLFSWTRSPSVVMK